jgi:RNA polymerase sigma-70 factor (ECF subfamily)
LRRTGAQEVAADLAAEVFAAAPRAAGCNVGGLGGQYGHVSDSHEQFEQVFQDCYEAVCRYTARRVTPDAVQDVVSDTFLAGWRRYGELKGDPLPWLLGIARRTAANHLRGSTRRNALHVRLSTENDKRADWEPDGDDPRLAIALSTLPERDREALMLVAWDGLKHSAAASVMGCSAGAFTVRLHRARRKLERALATDEGDAIDITQEARSLR